MASDSTEKIKRILLQQDSITKPELAQLSGLTTATCGYILNDLVKSGDIIAENFRISSGGRPAKSFRYNADKHLFLCLYAALEDGAEIIRYQVSNTLSAVRERGEFKEKRINAKTISARISKLIKNRPEICLAVIGIQGGVNEGTVEFSDFSELKDVNLATEIRKATGLPAFIENDMNSIALGYSQKNSEEKNVAILLVPKGNPPAGGFLVGGHILRGNANLAGEFSRFPFSFSKEKQSEIFSDFTKAFPHLMQILYATIVFLDPALVVFTGSFAAELSQKRVDLQMRNFLNRSHLPKILFMPDPQEEYFTGLRKIAVEKFLNGSAEI